MKVFRFIYFFILVGGFLYLLDLIFDFNQDDNTESTVTPTLTTANLNLALSSVLAEKIDGINDSIANLKNNSNTTISVEAGEDLLTDTVIVVRNNKAYKFDSTVEDNFSLPVGIILNQVSTGEFVIVFLTGKVTVHKTLSLNTPYFVGASGNIIENISDNMGIQSVGYATTNNHLILNFSTRLSL